jgi:hypothetical protein
MSTMPSFLLSRCVGLSAQVTLRMAKCRKKEKKEGDKEEDKEKD